MYEVELKAEITNLDKQNIIKGLTSFNPYKIEQVVYKDIYLDTSNSDLTYLEKELRIRTIVYQNGEITHTLTYKDTPFDIFSKSKEEIETKIEDVDNLVLILENLGYETQESYEKKCVNYYFNYTDSQVLATLVELSFSPQQFLEIEILTPVENDVENLQTVLVNIFTKLGVSEFTNEYYTELFKEWKMES